MTVSANSHWNDVQKKYDALVKTMAHAKAVVELQKIYTDLGPKNQQRLIDGNKRKKSPSPPPKSPSPLPKSPSSPATKTDQPTGQTGQTEYGLVPRLLTVKGLQHAYQCPDTFKGLVVFLHGCSRSVFGGWPRSSDARFFGLPEDVSRTKQALHLGYAVLYITPVDKKTGCFSARTDTKSVVDAINCATNCMKKKLPVYVFGCSAGGGLAQRMVASGMLKCDGMVNESATSADSSARTPPSVWVAMSTSKEQGVAKERVAALRKFGKPAEMLVSGKRKIHDEFFSDQIASIPPRTSKAIVASIMKRGLVDSGRNVARDPKDNKGWYAGLVADGIKIPETTIGFWNSSVAQALLVAWGVHDHTSMYTTACLKWFESGQKANLGELAKKYAVTRPAYFQV